MLLVFRDDYYTSSLAIAHGVEQIWGGIEWFDGGGSGSGGGFAVAAAAAAAAADLFSCFLLRYCRVGSIQNHVDVQAHALGRIEEGDEARPQLAGAVLAADDHA